jgi:hypothetical protein
MGRLSKKKGVHMALYKLLFQNPLLACSVCLCLLAIAVAIRLIRKLNSGSERFITGFVGLIAVYEGFKILMQAGIWIPSNASGWTDIATLAVTGMFVLALIVIQELGSEGHRTKFLLRLLEAGPNGGLKSGRQPEVGTSPSGLTTRSSPSRMSGVVAVGTVRANIA